MIRPISILVLAALCTASVAAPPAVIVTDAGYFSLGTDSGGFPITERITTVIDLRGQSSDEPAPGPIPAPAPSPNPPGGDKTPDEDLTRKATRWAESEIDPPGAAKIAMIYRQVSEAVRRGEVQPANASSVTRTASEAVAVGWDTFRTRVGSEAAERIATAGPMDAPRMADFLLAISLGVESVAEPASLQDAVKVTDAVNKAIGAK